MAEARPTALAPAAALVFNAFVWGLSWWPFRLLHEAGLHPLWSTCAIYAISLLCAVLYAPKSWAGLARHPLLWVLMASAGFTNMGFNWAVTVGDVVRVVLLFYLMPAWAVLLAWLVLGDRPTPASLMQLVLALAGVFVVLGEGRSGWPVPSGAADWLALLGGLSFALTNVMLRKLRAVPAPERVTAMFAGGVLASGGAALLGAAAGVVPPPPDFAPGWAALALGLGVAFLVGNVALQYGASRLAASTTALVMLSEVVFASLSSIALGAAALQPATWIGGALILAAAVWSCWPARADRRTIPA
jgi:drug/metabolite transporter (DMT)-like permease